MARMPRCLGEGGDVGGGFERDRHVSIGVWVSCLPLRLRSSPIRTTGSRRTPDCVDAGRVAATSATRLAKGPVLADGYEMPAGVAASGSAAGPAATGRPAPTKT
jgi:hypothetical protein